MYDDQAKPVIVEGVVTAEPDARDTYTNLRIEFDYREYLARQDVYSTPHLRWVQVSCRAHV